jgi:hypothetical protein
MMAKGNMAIGPLQIGIIVLTVITGVIHVWLGLSFGDTLFLLNGLGYFGLLGALYLPIALLASYRPFVRWALIGYTAVTVVLYFAFNWPDVWGPLGLFTKAVEVVLIALLFSEQRA